MGWGGVVTFGVGLSHECDNPTRVTIVVKPQILFAFKQCKGNSAYVYFGTYIYNVHALLHMCAHVRTQHTHIAIGGRPRSPW